MPLPIALTLLAQRGAAAPGPAPPSVPVLPPPSVPATRCSAGALHTARARAVSEPG